MSEVLKNEKDTQGVPNSDKNHNKYTKKNINNAIILAERFHTSIVRRYSYLSDPTAINDITYLEKEFLVLKKVIENNPRLPWQVIQDNIDRLYKRDPSIIGVNIQLIFNDLKKDNLKYFNPVIYGIFSE